MAILPSTLLGILPVGCLLSMHGTLSAETFLAVIVLSFGVMQPLITAFSYTDDIAQVKTIVGEVAEVLSDEDMQRPTTAEKLPADNSIELKDVRFAYHDKEVLHGINLNIAPGCESIVETEKKMTKGARREIVRCEQTDRTLLRDLPSQ